MSTPSALLALLAVAFSPSVALGHPAGLELPWAPPTSLFRGAPEGPSITVRATTQVVLEKMERVKGGVMLTLRLMDGELGEGIPDRSVTAIIGLEGVEVFRTSQITNQAGSAQIFVPHHRGEYDVSLGFSGDPLYAAASPTTSKVDLHKDAVELTLSVPPRMDVGSRPLPVTLAAKQNAPIADLPVDLIVRREGKVLLRRQGLTDPEGLLRMEISTLELGGAGEILVEALSKATAAYNSARTAQRVFLLSETTTALRFTRTRGRQDAQLQGMGRVTDISGPVPTAAVRIQALGRVLSTVITDSQGHFSTTVPLRHLPVGQVAVTAEFVPASAWRKPSRSLPVMIVVEPQKPIPMAYFLVPSLVTLVFLGVLILAHRRAWRNLRLPWRRGRRGEMGDNAGINLGRRRSMSGIFGADLFGLRGTVLDARLGTPLGGAIIYLRARSRGLDDRRGQAELDGTFSLTEMTAGSWEILVTHPGYLPQSLAVTVPHRGELHGLLVRLQSVRHRVMDIYANVMVPRLPDPALVRFCTPREAATHLRTQKAPVPAAVEALSDLAAEVYYGAETPDAQRVTDAETLASRIGDPEEPTSTPPPEEPR